MSDNVSKSSVFRADALTGGGSTGYRRGENRITSVAAASASKIVLDRRHARGKSGIGKNPDPNMNALASRSQRIATNINDIENIFEILPEIERCQMILVSCILSPDDMKTINFLHTCESSDLPQKFIAEALDLIKEFTTIDYKIKDIAPKILGDVLCKTGSYPIAIIPESTLDYLINYDNGNLSQEQLNIASTSLGPIGTLGDDNDTVASSKMSYEDIFTLDSGTGMKNPVIVNNVFGVTDNPAWLRMPQLQERITSERLSRIYGQSAIRTQQAVSTEAFDIDSMDREETRDGARIDVQGRVIGEVARRLAVRRRHRTEQVVSIRTQGIRNNIGHPLIMKLPSDSVIPVYVPNDPSHHIGYYVLIDEYGNAVSQTEDSLYVRQLKNRQGNSNETSQVLTEVRTQLYGADWQNAKTDDERDLDADYGDMLLTKLTERLANGAYKGRRVQVSMTNDNYQLVFSRLLANKYTQALFIPAELMTYYAFDYTRDGIGRSLSDRSKILASIRSILLMSSTQAAVRAAVGHKNLAITLDPNDPTPEKTVEELVHDYIEINNGKLPLGSSDPNDIFTYLTHAGVSVSVTGHPDYPEVGAELNSQSSAIQPIDPEIDRDLRARHIQSYGLAPETVDAVTGVDFAATIRTSNVYLDKQISIYADQFCLQTTAHIRKIFVNSGALMDRLYRLVDKYKDEIEQDKFGRNWRTEAAIEFLDNYKFSIPDPQNTKLETQAQKLNVFIQLLDVVMAAFASPEMLAMMDPEMDQNACEATINAMKRMFIRQEIIKQGIMPEVVGVMGSDIDGESEDSKRFLQFIASNTKYVEGMKNMLSSLMSQIKENRTKQAELRGDDGVVNDSGNNGDSWGDDSGGDSMDSWDDSSSDTTDPDMDSMDTTEITDTTPGGDLNTGGETDLNTGGDTSTNTGDFL